MHVDNAGGEQHTPSRNLAADMTPDKARFSPAERRYPRTDHGNAVGMGLLLEQGEQFAARNALRKARVVMTFRYEVGPAFAAVEQDDVAAITGQIYCRRQPRWPAADYQTVDIVRLHRKLRFAMFGKKSGSACAA